MKRRTFLAMSAGACAPSLAHTAEAADEKQKIVDAFMEKFRVPGLSVAFAKQGKLLFSKAYGFADMERNTALTSSHLFRIASVSKPITAVAVFTLIEVGKLKLSDEVFGKDGILAMEGPEGMTVEHLLNHTGGGWSNSGGKDPMFEQLKLDHDGLIQWTLKNVKLTHKPGEKYAYSNFGYCLLGRVIEKVISQTYVDYVSEQVLQKCRISEMKMGQDALAKGEVVYYDDLKKPNRSHLNTPRMDAHGGWIGTPEDLVKFGLHVDGFGSPRDILTPASIKKMTAHEGIHKGYGCGWGVNQHGNYWHMGSLPGLTSILVRTKSGFVWSACANTRRKGMNGALDKLMWDLSKHV